MKINTVLKSFVQDLEKKNRSISTILAYRKDIEQLIESVDVKEIGSIKAEQIEKFKQNLNKQGYTAKSISRKINAIKSFFRFAQANKWLKNDPATAVTHPKYEVKLPRILAKIEYRALRDAVRENKRMAAIIELLLQTGMRIGEMARLTLDDMNLKKNTAIINPYQSQPARQVPINDQAKKSLEQYLEVRPKAANQTLFLTKTGRPFLIRNIRSAINRYFKLAGIKSAKVNDIRSTFIVQQLQAGVPLTTVSKIIGHKRLSTTEKYLEMIDKPAKQKPKLEAL